MGGSIDATEHILNTVQSPLKARNNEGAKKGESTFAVEGGEAALKGEYELARDRRVAALQEYLKPVQAAATTLYAAPILASCRIRVVCNVYAASVYVCLYVSAPSASPR